MPDSTPLARLLEYLVPLAPLDVAVPVIRRRQLIAQSDALLAEAFGAEAELPARVNDCHGQGDHRGAEGTESG